ncbi:MAG: RpiB/LacA/LacB family sugar-phosphate isomerase [Phycisphaerae bacterium]|nr:RpiB/LacA/LacB family sugar-phosphate isomerase [Phycisphaerae bacterium]
MQNNSHTLRVAVGADHGGFALKQTVLDEVRRLGHQPIDCGAAEYLAQDDYPDYAIAVGRAVAGGKADRGILICGSGVGVVVTANKVRGVRACLCHDTFSAGQGVNDDDMNVLALGARVIGPELAKLVVAAFLAARFRSDIGRYVRRLEKIKGLEST